jgi:hypothetical protein
MDSFRCYQNKKRKAKLKRYRQQELEFPGCSMDNELDMNYNGHTPYGKFMIFDEECEIDIGDIMIKELQSEEVLSPFSLAISSHESRRNLNRKDAKLRWKYHQMKSNKALSTTSSTKRVPYEPLLHESIVQIEDYNSKKLKFMTWINKDGSQHAKQNKK